MNDLILYQPNLDNYPLIKSEGKKIGEAINKVGGASSTLLLDEMGINREKNPIKRAYSILAQIDSIDEALIQNSYRRKRAELSLKYYKFLYKFVPRWLFGDLLSLYIKNLELGFDRSEKLFVAAMTRKENYIKLYKEITDKVGPLTKDKIEEQEKKTQVMQLFSQTMACVMERGSPKEGMYLFADELGLVSFSELRKEVMDFLIEIKNNEPHIRDRTVNEQQEFLERMGEKYGSR